MATIIMLCGLDMVHGLSPLTFCLRVDPLMVLLALGKDVKLVQAYMDDLQLGADWMKARIFFQVLIRIFASASGLDVTSQSCVKAIYVKTIPARNKHCRIKTIKWETTGASRTEVLRKVNA